MAKWGQSGLAQISTFDISAEFGNRKWTKRDGGTGDVFGYDYADQVTALKLNIQIPTRRQSARRPLFMMPMATGHRSLLTGARTLTPLTT
jgi:hypothetical protein